METATLIIAAATLFVTTWMLIYMKRSDRIKNKKSEDRRRKDILARIESKENQLKQKELLASLNGSEYGPQVERLKDDISELRNML